MSQSLNQIRTSLVETSFGRIRVWEHGPPEAPEAGAPIVFLQGFLARPDAWTDTLGRMRSRQRCITVDWPFGAHSLPLRADADVSPPGIARLVIEVLDVLGIERATLVGNDSGGVIAQLVVASDPQRVHGLVLVSCDAFDVFPPGVYRHVFRLAALPGTVGAMAKMMALPAFAKSRFGYGAVISRMPERALAWATPLASDPGIRRDLAKLMAGSSNRQTLWAAEHFADYQRPVLVVWAERDRLFPGSLGTRLARAFPQGRCEVVADSSTFVPMDRPDRLAALLDEFVAEVG
jgi:pimeloyl-ACP methyl ester carboxylesterase